MISLLLVTLTCPDIKEIIAGVRQHESLPNNVREEIIIELLEVAPPGCKDLKTELS